MESFRAKSGPTKNRPYFTDREFEEVSELELKALSLLPCVPEAIRIDRFVEKRFGAHVYSEMPEGILGFTRFGRNGVEEVVISASLENESTLVSGRRVRTTLAHEAGHGLLHAYLFINGKNTQPQLFDDEHDDTPQILCRDIAGIPTQNKRAYDDRWWEYQANKMMGALLLPRSLVQIAMLPHIENAGLLGAGHLTSENRMRAVEELSTIFDVNRVVVEIRLAGLYPKVNEQQLQL